MTYLFLTGVALKAVSEHKKLLTTLYCLKCSTFGYIWIIVKEDQFSAAQLMRISLQNNFINVKKEKKNPKEIYDSYRTMLQCQIKKSQTKAKLIHPIVSRML